MQALTLSHRPQLSTQGQRIAGSIESGLRISIIEGLRMCKLRKYYVVSNFRGITSVESLTCSLCTNFVGQYTIHAKFQLFGTISVIRDVSIEAVHLLIITFVTFHL